MAAQVKLLEDRVKPYVWCVWGGCYCALVRPIAPPNARAGWPTDTPLLLLPPRPSSSLLRSDVAVTFDSAQHAKIACRTLAVDPELQPLNILRRERVEGDTMHVHFAATELRLLRVALSSFYDVAILTAGAINEFS